MPARLAYLSQRSSAAPTNEIAAGSDNIGAGVFGTQTLKEEADVDWPVCLETQEGEAMKKLADIADITNCKLKWTQPGAFKMHYELHAGDELAATLRFRRTFGTLATGESADGCWTFKRAGFFQTRVTIRVCGEETDIAIFRNNTWSGGGALELPDGRKVLATTNLWQTRLEFTTEAGEALLRFQSAGLIHLSALVEIQPQAIGLDEMPWMVMLGWYLIVMMNMDSAAAAAVIG